MAANDTKNVSTGKGIAGGYLFSAARTAANLALVLTLSNFTVKLTGAFANLGYVASEGINEAESVDTNTDMNGNAINTSRSNRVETERFKLAGAIPDGFWGWETSTKVQEHLISKGYSCGECGADGYFGNDSVRALQRCLNDGKLR